MTLFSTTSVQRRLAVASTVALVAAGVTGLTLPVSIFQASAIVAVDEPSAALRLAASRSAADLAVSKTVIARAAASLNGTMTGSVPAFVDALVPTVSANAGDRLVEIRARAADGSRAAKVATALAEALVAEEEGVNLAAVSRREQAASARIETLRESARAAHARFAALGGSESNSAEALAAAGVSTRAAETRLAAVHAVIAAGTPPLGAGSELPQSAAVLQQTYWELKKQLDKASETMGERHTTVIALHDGVSRAAAALTAEWQRIERAAASDVTVARSREAVLRRSAVIADPAKRAALEEARGTSRLADAALAHAIAAPAVTTPLNPLFRLVAPAAVPATATGLGPWRRGTITGSAGIGAFALAWLAARRRRDRPFTAAWFDEASVTPSNKTDETTWREFDAMPMEEIKALPDLTRTGAPFAFDEAQFVPVECRTPDYVTAVSANGLADAADQSGYEHVGSDWLETRHKPVSDETIAAMLIEAAYFDSEPEPSIGPHPISSQVSALDPDLREALRAVAAGLETLGSGRMATVMVACKAAGVDTSAVALGFGEVAAELGYRVLVIEGERAQPTLAEAVAPNADPLLVKACGALRVALPSERLCSLFLAPALRDGARIAEALACNTQAEIIDNLSAAFDAVVIDGGRAADSAAAGWSADAYIRVGRFNSHKDDALLLETFDAPEEAFLGTVVAGRFVPYAVPAMPPVVVRPRLRAIPASFDVTSPRRPVKAPPLRMPTRRRSAR